MPSLDLSIPHNLDREEATTRLSGLMQHVLKQYGEHVKDVQTNWEDSQLNFSFSTYGFAIKGHVAVEDEAVRVNGTLPMAAVMMRGKIESSIRDQLGELLA